jgi:hypothetical protein
MHACTTCTTAGANTAPVQLNGVQMPPTNRTFELPPEACSVTFDERGFVTRLTAGYVMDPEVSILCYLVSIIVLRYVQFLLSQCSVGHCHHSCFLWPAAASSRTTAWRLLVLDVFAQCY